MIIETNGKAISNIAGQRSINIKYLIHKYKFKNIKIYEKDIPMGIVDITIDNIFKRIYRQKTIQKYLKEKLII